MVRNPVTITAGAALHGSLVRGPRGQGCASEDEMHWGRTATSQVACDADVEGNRYQLINGGGMLLFFAAILDQRGRYVAPFSTAIN